MVQASVGFQCPECAGAAPQRVVRRQELFRGHPQIIVGKVLIGLNVAAFVLMVALSRDPYRASGEIFERFALWGPLVADGEWWRLISGAFLHSGLFHLGMNMLLLWFLAQELEPALGHVRFALLYLVSLIGGSLGVMLLSPLSPTVGASGAVFGLMGALVVLQLRARQNPWQSGIGGLVLINLILTFTIPGISVGGHVGGLIAGGVSALVMHPQQRPEQGVALRDTYLVGLAVVLFTVAVAAATALTDNVWF